MKRENKAGRTVFYNSLVGRLNLVVVVLNFVFSGWLGFELDIIQIKENVHLHLLCRRKVHIIEFLFLFL